MRLLRSVQTIISAEADAVSSAVGGGTISSMFLKIGDILDAQVFLGVVLYNKHGNVFFLFISKLNFYPPYQGSEKTDPPLYGEK